MSSEINYRAIRQYIQRGGFEGPSHNVGYVPPDPQGNSGVTIGVGFDLGQHNKQDLINMGFSKGMRDKLAPYLGKKGQAAIDIKKQKPLVLGENSQEYLEAIMRPTKFYTDKIAAKYDESTGVAGDFASLDPSIQGTLFSVLYQYGMTNPSKTTPKFWKHATSKNWSGLLNELEQGQWGKEDIRRRKLEAKMLKENSNAIVAQSVIDQDGPNIGGIYK
mgnify:FL=1